MCFFVISWLRANNIPSGAKPAAISHFAIAILSSEPSLPTCADPQFVITA